MNRFKLVVSLLTMCSVLWAVPIDKQTARQRAQEFLAQKQSIKPVTRAPQTVKVCDAVKQADNEPLYLFNADSGQGFVIVSGDDRTDPILGYSTNGAIDPENMPANLQSWLQHYADEIAQLQKYDAIGSLPEVPDCGEPIDVQLTCQWDQSPVYNAHCPKVRVFGDSNCGRPYVYAPQPQQSVTGCAATALAQALYKWKSVSATTAEIPARPHMVFQDEVTSSLYGPVGTPIWISFSDEAIPAGTRIDWDNILPKYLERDAKGNLIRLGTDAEREAVANLMHICGASMDMLYGTTWGSGSLAFPNVIALAASRYLGFTNATTCVQPFYEYKEWMQLLYDELKVAGAVVFTGQSSTSSHAFVVDGYEGKDLFHVNWGWSGTANGMYKLGSMCPSSMGIGGFGDDGFRLLQLFVRGLYPDAPALNPGIRVASFYIDEDVVIKPDNGHFRLPAIHYNAFCCMNLNARLGVTLQSTDQKSTIALGDYSQIAVGTQLAGLLGTIRLAQSELQDGEYRCYLSYTTAGDDSWEPCPGFEHCWVKLTVSDGQMSLCNQKPFLLSVVSSGNQKSYCPESPILFTVTMKVDAGSVHEPVTAVCVPAGITPDPSQEGYMSCGMELYYASEGETFDVDFEIPAGLPEGLYDFYLTPATGGVISICTIQIKENSSAILQTEKTDNSVELPAYNLNGQRISNGYKGIAVRRGSKYVQKR